MKRSKTSLIENASESQLAKGRPRRNTVTFSDSVVTHVFQPQEDQCARQTNSIRFNNEDRGVQAEAAVFPTIQVWDIDDSETFAKYMTNLQMILS
jgi:hypothetical protein